MNHVQNIAIWRTGYGLTFLTITRERGKMKKQQISDCKAASVGRVVFDMVRRNKVRVYPIIIEDFFGWLAHRINPRPC